MKDPIYKKWPLSWGQLYINMQHRPCICLARLKSFEASFTVQQKQPLQSLVTFWNKILETKSISMSRNEFAVSPPGLQNTFERQRDPYCNNCILVWAHVSNDTPRSCMTTLATHVIARFQRSNASSNIACVAATHCQSSPALYSRPNRQQQQHKLSDFNGSRERWLNCRKLYNQEKVLHSALQGLPSYACALRIENTFWASFRTCSTFVKVNCTECISYFLPLLTTSMGNW